MEMILTIIFIIIILVIIFLVYVKPWLNLNRLKKIFKSSSTITFGKKGAGKDLLTQCVIYKRNEEYLSTQDYGYKYNHIDLKPNLELGLNTYENFIQNNVYIINKKIEYEKKDIYISDVGVYLPSSYDYLLNKEHKSLPLMFALSRHLYNSNIHCNTQNVERVRKLLREQADNYIKVRRTIRIFNTFYIFYRTYDKYDSAVNDLRPLSRFQRNKYGKTDYNIYLSTHGEIKNGYIKIKKKYIKYDTRHFHKVVFGYKFKDLSIKEKLQLLILKRRLNIYVRLLV